MSHPLRNRVFLVSLSISLFLVTVFLSPSTAAEKDTAAGEEDVYLYGGNAGEVLMYASTAMGDVDGDGKPDLVVGHDQGGDDFPYFYTGKVYVYFGRDSLDPQVDLGSEADVVINGYYGSFLGGSVACGDVNGDGVDDIVMGAMWDSPGGNLFSGSVAVVFGGSDLKGKSPWDFNATGPDLFLSSGEAGEMCGMSVICGDIDGDGFDDVLYGAHLGNGGVHFYDGTEWTGQGRANQDSLYDLCMIDATHGWAVGKYVSAYDTLYRYDGTGWEADTLFEEFKTDFYGVASSDANHTWAVGAGGLIAFNGNFNDTGAWTRQSSGTSADLRDVACLDASNAWAVGDGGTILRTTDGGATWSAVSPKPTTANLRGIAVVDASNAWAVGDGGTILRFNGTAWTAVTPKPTTANLRAVTATDAGHVWAVGDGGTILFYNGTSWILQSSPSTAHLRGVSAAGASNVWAVGEGGAILRTTNGGNTWALQPVLFSQNLNAVDALNAGNVWAVGDAATGRAYITWGRSTWPAWDYNNPLPPNKVINGVDSLDAAGFPVSAGDLNGDGKADMVIGAFDADGPGNSREGCGEAYVVYGRNKGAFPYSVNLSTMSDCTIAGASKIDGLPTAVCRPLKKVNGDRYDDLVLGAMWGDGPGDTRSQCGEVAVIYGGALPSSIDLAAVPPDVLIYGPEDNALAGCAVDVLDFDGDRLPDLAVSSTSTGKGTERTGGGAVWLLSGASLLASQVDMAAGTEMTFYGAETKDAFGFCLASANLDRDAKGFQDLVVTSLYGDGPQNSRTSCGEHFVFLGYDCLPPTCSITSPAGGAVLSGTVRVEATAYDYHGVARVEFLVDGVLWQTDTTAPYQWDWDTLGLEDADYLVEARAYDVNGNSSSDSRRVSVKNAVPPTCAITSPAGGAVLSGTVRVEAAADGYPPIQRVDFLVNGALRHTDDTAPYQWDWDTLDEEDGAGYILEARAYNTKGATASDTRDLSINNTIPSPSRIWYLAEGCTAYGFETWVLVQNPDPEPAQVTMTFMKPGGSTQEYAFTMEGNSRRTVFVNELVAESDVSTRVEADRPVICERAMYWRERSGGHDSMGVTSPSRTWYLAEGCTAYGFETWVLVQNPDPEPAQVTMTFMKPGGATQEYRFTMEGNSRRTVFLNELVAESDVSTRVEADRPVICERAMYRYERGLGHDTVGTPSLSRTWYLAEGTTAWGFDLYILIQNPNPRKASIGLEFMLPDGTVKPFGVVVDGNSRYTIPVDGIPGLEETDLSTFVSSDLPVICERAMYWQGRASAGGHDTIGTPVPSRTWYLAEGCTAYGFETWVLVQNPHPEPAQVTMTFMKPGGATQEYRFTMEGNSRRTVFLNELVAESDVSTRVEADRPVICERAMYWKDRDGGHVSIGVRGG